MGDLQHFIPDALARFLGLVHTERDESGNGIRAVYEARLEQTHTETAGA